MNTTHPFTADSNKLAYAQAFTRTSTRRTERSVRSQRRRPITLRRTHKFPV